MDILIFILCVYFTLKVVRIIESFRQGKKAYDKIGDLTFKVTGKDGGNIDISKKDNKLRIKIVDKEGNTLIDTDNE